MLFPCDKSERTEYYSDGIGYMVGDMPVRIAPDGMQTTLATPDDILIDEVKTNKSVVRSQSLFRQRAIEADTIIRSR